ncbi:MAG: hypothetical protein C0442_07985 [Chlorobiaceae bacterium]|nr:hypothetical protein [Chlorobiaceae bacterium]
MQPKNWKFILLISLNVIAIIFLVITVSRGAIISYAIFLGLMFVIVFGYKKLLLVGAASIVVLIIALQINFTNKYLNHLLFKGDAKIYSTRAVMYESSLDAAIKGGVFGLGFNVSDPEQFRKWLIRESNGFVLREKGSSLLALIEEVGVIGMLLFYLPQLLILLSLIKRFRRVSFNKSIKLISEEKLRYGFAIAVLISLIIHSQVEAWGTGVGSVFFPLFLILFFLFERLSREEKNTNAIFQ